MWSLDTLLAARSLLRHASVLDSCTGQGLVSPVTCEMPQPSPVLECRSRRPTPPPLLLHHRTTQTLLSAPNNPDPRQGTCLQHQVLPGMWSSPFAARMVSRPCSLCAAWASRHSAACSGDEQRWRRDPRFAWTRPWDLARPRTPLHHQGMPHAAPGPGVQSSGQVRQAHGSSQQHLYWHGMRFEPALAATCTRPGAWRVLRCPLVVPPSGAHSSQIRVGQWSQPPLYDADKQAVQ